MKKVRKKREKQRGKRRGRGTQENRALKSNAYNFKRGSFDSKVNRPGIRLPELSLTSNTVLQGTLLSGYGISPGAPIPGYLPPTPG